MTGPYPPPPPGEPVRWRSSHLLPFVPAHSYVFAMHVDIIELQGVDFYSLKESMPGRGGILGSPQIPISVITPSKVPSEKSLLIIHPLPSDAFFTLSTFAPNFVLSRSPWRTHTLLISFTIASRFGYSRE